MILISAENKTVCFTINGPEELPELIALASVESENNDKKIGKHGEVSRYQISPEEWKYFNIHYYSVVFWRDHKIAAQVAYMRHSIIMHALYATLRRHPNAYEFYLACKGCKNLRIDKAPYKLREKAITFYNLCLLEQNRN